MTELIKPLNNAQPDKTFKMASHHDSPLLFYYCSGKKLYSKDEWNAAFLGFDAIREAAKKANGFIIDPASIMYAVPNAPVSKQKDKNADA